MKKIIFFLLFFKSLKLFTLDIQTQFDKEFTNSLNDSNFQKIESLLKHGAQVTYQSLLSTIFVKEPKIFNLQMKYAINQKFDFNYKGTSENKTLLFLSVKFGRYFAVQTLLPLTNITEEDKKELKSLIKSKLSGIFNIEEWQAIDKILDEYPKKIDPIETEIPVARPTIEISDKDKDENVTSNILPPAEPEPEYELVSSEQENTIQENEDGFIEC